MSNSDVKKAVAGAGLLMFAALAGAGPILSQAQLSAILGGNETLEDFEGNGLLPPTGQIYQAGANLNAGSTFGVYGPGLVKPGATYSANELWFNENGYFGLTTRTLADSSAWRGDAITITYSQPVTDFGFDLQGYSGYSQTGTVDVYDTANNLLTSVGVNGGFFGWDNPGGIGRVTISASADSYIMIDNHGFGAVPEPGSLALFGTALGLLGLLRKRG